MKISLVKVILHLEGLFVFPTALYLYGVLAGNWILFALLLFTPDASMLGYLRDNKLGAIFYNLVHNYILSLVIIIVGRLIGSDLLMQLGVILLAHVGLDRSMGYGLKYMTRFQDTHLQHV